MTAKIAAERETALSDTALSDTASSDTALSGTAGRDVARFGSAVAVGTALGVVQVFLIPRRLDVAAFGAWRVFLVYVAYAGVLHVGVADGAFLRWAGRPAGAIAREWRRVALWLLSLHGAVLAVALAVLPWVAAAARPFVVAFAACAAAMNLATLAGYALQTAGDFRGAGRVAALPPALFVAAMLVLLHPSIGVVLGTYVASFGAAAGYGALLVLNHRGHRGHGGLQRHSSVFSVSSVVQIKPSMLLRTGLPVLGANVAAGLSQFADRILVSATIPVARFALYGFASSVMVAASAATQALSRVALSHAARRDVVGGARARFLDGFHDLVAAGAGAALAGVPAFEVLVARLLPAYVPALPIVRALVLGAPFGIAVHVVLVGTLQSYGLVRRQLALELAGLALALAACGACLAWGTPLWAVAAAASGAAVLTWALGAAFVRRSVGAGNGEGTRRFALCVGAQGAALGVALGVAPHWAVRTLVYAALALAPTIVAGRAARAHGWR